MLDPEDAVARGLFTMRAGAKYERGDFERALAEADVVVEGTYRTSVVLHNSMETHQSVCEWVGDTLNVYISTQYIWGVRDEVAEELGLPGDKVRVVCEYMGGGFGAKNGAGRVHLHRRRARKAHGAPRAVRADAARGEHRRRQPQRDDPEAHGRRAERRHDRRARRRVHQRASAGRGWSAMTEGPMQMLYACDNVRTRSLRREDQHAADEGVPRARASSRARSGSSA